MLAIMAGHSAVRGFGFQRFAIRRHQHRSHQPQRTKALRHRVRLNVTVVILAGPHKGAVPFQRRRHHIVDQLVLIDDAFGRK